MRGFDSSYSCIFNVSTYLNLKKPTHTNTKRINNKRINNKRINNKRNNISTNTKIRQKTHFKLLFNKRTKLTLLWKKRKTGQSNKQINQKLNKYIRDKKTNIFSKKKHFLLKQGRFFLKKHLFKIFKFKRLRSKTFFFKNTKRYSLTKFNRLHTLVLKQNFRKKRINRRQYFRKTRSTFLLAKIARMRGKSSNFYLKSLAKDVRVLKSFIPLNYRTSNYKKASLLNNTYLKFLRKISFSRFISLDRNLKKKKSYIHNPFPKKKSLYNSLQADSNVNATLQGRRLSLKTSRLLRKRLSPSKMAGAFFQKYTNFNHITNLKPQFIYNKSGLFNIKHFCFIESISTGYGHTLQQYMTNTWLNVTLRSCDFLINLHNPTQLYSTSLQHAQLTFYKVNYTTLTHSVIPKNNAPATASSDVIRVGLSKWLAPALRYGDATFFKKSKTSLRQLKQHLKLTKGYTPINVSRRLDFREKAVTDASFTRINSDDTIFADTEFANVIARFHKLPSLNTLQRHDAVFFKNTYPFYFFLTNNLNYLRSKNVASYKVNAFDLNKRLLSQTTSTMLSKNLMFFLWKIKITKPRPTFKKFYKRVMPKPNPRRSISKFFNKLVNKRRRKSINLRRFFKSFFRRQLSKLKTSFFTAKNTYFMKKRNLTNKLFVDRRIFKWSLPIRKNQKFFKRLELKINKDLRRKQVLYSYFKNRNNIETKPILRKNKFNNFTKNTPLEHSSDKNFLIKPNTISNVTQVFTPHILNLLTEPSTFQMDYINLVFKNPFLLKTGFFLMGSSKNMLYLVNTKLLILSKYFSSKSLTPYTSLHTSNLIPHNSFTFSVSRKIFSLLSIKVLASRVTPWYYNNIIRFIEDLTGRKVLFQFYPFMSQEVSKENIVRYKRWLPRMSYYERRLGHRFFLEESLHILHLGFSLKDAVLIGSWLKSMILRISFWKTKFIFRFLKYLFQNYFKFIFNDLSVKGLKIKLKGKISVAGNSRKRTILYRVGSTSHSSLDLRVVNHSQTINTFTGVMGLQVWVFY